MVTTGTISNEDPVNLIVSSSGHKKKPEETQTSEFTNFGNVTQDLSQSTFLNVSYNAVQKKKYGNQLQMIASPTEAMDLLVKESILFSQVQKAISSEKLEELGAQIIK